MLVKFLFQFQPILTYPASVKVASDPVVFSGEIESAQLSQELISAIGRQKYMEMYPHLRLLLEQVGPGSILGGIMTYTDEAELRANATATMCLEFVESLLKKAIPLELPQMRQQILGPGDIDPRMLGREMPRRIVR